MGKKGLKAAFFMALFAGLSAALSAQVTVSAGLALSVMTAKASSGSDSESLDDGTVGVGGNVYLDYLLPVGVPLSLGLEIGVDTASVEHITGTAVPILLRAAYHFDLMSNLDLYLVGKIGYVAGSAKAWGETESGFNGIGLGIDAGAAYYFTSRFGIFGEAGFDWYNLQKKISGITVELPFYRFLTFGVSAKF
jgi:hypothetical protein